MTEMKINYDYLRPKKAEALKKWQSRELLRKEKLSVNSHKDAAILPLKKLGDKNLSWGCGGVVDSKNEYIKESKLEKLIDGAYEFDECEKSDKKVVYCGYFRNHWGELLTLCLSRLWYFLEDDASIDKYVFFIDYDEQREIKGNYREFLELLGVWDKIEIINKPTRYKEVVIPEESYNDRTRYYSAYYLDIFRRISENAKNAEGVKPKKKLFFTRSQLSKAKSMEFGMEMLDDYFAKNGYEVIAPEKISLSQLIYLINNSEVCAAMSGTLPHNMLFGSDGKKLIILERNALNNKVQIDVNKMKKLDVTYIDANICLYPVELAYGPFIYAFNNQLRRFTEDNKYLPPDESFTQEKYKKYLFKNYLRQYKKEHNLCWYMDNWMLKFTDSLYEAYSDGESYFQDYMKGNKCIFWYQYFSIDYIKKLIKRIIRRK